MFGHLFGQIIGALLILGGNYFDYSTTLAAFAAGLKDANPLIKPDTLVPIKVGGTAVQLAIMHFVIPGHAIALGVALCVFYLAVGFWNKSQTFTQ